MDKEKEEDLFGFADILMESSFLLDLKYKRSIEILERNLQTYVETGSTKYSKMDLSITKCYEEACKSTNASFKGIIADNDSGYISQNMESNSSVEMMNDNRLATVGASVSEVQNVYVNEDTLLEKPQISSSQEVQHEPEGEQYEEFGHLFYMSGISEPVVPSSVASASTSFSGFEEDDSEISDVSGTIPIAAPLIISSNNVNIQSNSNEKLNNSIVEQSCSRKNVGDVFLPFARNDSKEFSDNVNENYQNYLNVNNNFKLISHEDSNLSGKSSNLSHAISESNISSIQTRLMDANTYGMSLFESFYSHLCGLYTRSDFPSEDLQQIAINPHNLQISNQAQNDLCNASPYKNSYLELESKNTETSLSNEAVVHTNLTKNVCGESVEIENDHSEINNDEIVSKNVTTENRQVTPTKIYKNTVNPDVSPELFSDEELSEPPQQRISLVQKTCEQIYISKNDRKLLKHAQESLGNVLPPPSVTIMQITVDEILQKIKANEDLFLTNNDLVKELDVNNVQKESVSTAKVDNLNSDNKEQSKTSAKPEIRESLLVTCKKEDFIPELWPNVMQYRYHGLHHNRSKISEDFEHLCLKYAERYVGAETQSSCTVFGFGADVLSPSRRRFKLKRIAKSPGKRLSHLARRKITFSKDSLHSGVGPSSCSFIGARTRQIMVDARKFELLQRRKSPKKRSPRKTPGKSPRKKSRTPGSSTKKRFAMRLRMYSTDETMDSVVSSSSSCSRASITKRALFQSPPNRDGASSSLSQFFTSSTSNSESSQPARRRTPRRALFTSPAKSSPSKMSISSLYPPKRKLTPKRTLFMSPNKSPSKYGDNCDKKRKRVDTDDAHPSKFSRSMSLGLKALSNESKSRTAVRSHSVTGPSGVQGQGSSNDSKSRTMMRSHSVTGPGGLQTQEMGEHRKKKLMWAVAEALRTQNIDMKHPQFKVFASVLARLIRHFLPNLFINGPRSEGSTTESMLRIARQHVFAVTRGKTVNQIVREVENSKVRPNKPSGYVGLDKVDRASDVSQARNKENILQDRVNIINSSDRTGSECSQRSNKSTRGEKVERIRRVINFGDDDEVSKLNIR